jgi:hypothetical protein
MNPEAITSRRGLVWAGLAVGFLAVATTAAPAAAGRVAAPLLCDQGPSGQRFVVGTTLPASAESGSTYAVRIDGESSGKISHFGLNHLHDLTVEYVLPAGASYVEGSAQLVPGTGTPNVLVSPRLSHRAGVVTLLLPDKVENGTSYTPPSIRLRLRAVATPGAPAVVAFRQYRLKANAFLVGDVAVTCDPSPKPYPIGTTLITPASPTPRD